MSLKNALFGAVMLLGSAAGEASAATLTYSAQLSGAAENPPNASAGSGTALVVFDDVLLTMSVNASFTGLTGTTTVAHIHCCVDPFGTAGVATTTPTFPLFPVGVTSGNYSEVFDMTLASSFNAAFITANGGSMASALAALLAGMDSGRAYFNIHTSFVASGEIRGFLSPVPIPAALPLLVSGLGALGFIGWRSKRKEKLTAA